MKSGAINRQAKVPRGILYCAMMAIGTLIILFCSFVHHTAAPKQGEYHYSSFLINNYTVLSNVFFFITGLFVGYFSKLNPLLSGICLFLVYPLTALVEASVYKGSHNLIPFELVMYFLMALPTVTAVYIARFVHSKVGNRKGWK